MGKSLSEKPAVRDPRQEYELAGVVADRIQILDVILVNTKASRKPGVRLDLREADLSTDVTTKCAAKQENKALSVVATFTLSASNKDEPDKPFLSIGAEFVLLYLVDTMDGLTQKHFEAFANANGVFNAWPYWREYVHSMAQRMGLGTLVVPVFRVKGKRPGSAVLAGSVQGDDGAGDAAIVKPTEKKR